MFSSIGDWQTTVDIALNASALSDLNAAGSGYFSIGGALTSGSALYIWADSPGISNQLLVEVVSEPGTLSMLALGLVMLHRRRLRGRAAR